MQPRHILLKHYESTEKILHLNIYVAFEIHYSSTFYGSQMYAGKIILNIYRLYYTVSPCDIWLFCTF